MDTIIGIRRHVAITEQIMLVAQESHVMRLLARAVRLESLGKAVEYGSRMNERNAAYTRHDALATLATSALEPPKMMRFEGP